MDKHPVTVLSTIHYDEMVDARCRTRQAVGGTEVVKKPNMIVQYSTYLGGVDTDQLLVYYGYSHFTKKWWKRVFFHLLDVALTSSIAPLRQRMTHLDFRLSVAQGLIQRSEIPRNLIPVPPSPPQVRQSARSNPTRLIGRDHFPEPTVGKQDCKVCSSRAPGGKRKRSAFQCNTCKVTLCVHPCFRSYHMKKRYCVNLYMHVLIHSHHTIAYAMYYIVCIYCPVLHYISAMEYNCTCRYLHML